MERIATFLSGGRLWRRGHEVEPEGGDPEGPTGRLERWARRLLGI